MKMWFRIPKQSISNGLVEFYGDGDVMRMAQLGVKHDCILVNVEADDLDKCKEGEVIGAKMDDVDGVGSASAKSENENEQFESLYSYKTEQDDEEYDDVRSNYKLRRMRGACSRGAESSRKDVGDDDDQMMATHGSSDDSSSGDDLTTPNSSKDENDGKNTRRKRVRPKHSISRLIRDYKKVQGSHVGICSPSCNEYLLQSERVNFKIFIPQSIIS